MFARLKLEITTILFLILFQFFHQQAAFRLQPVWALQAHHLRSYVRMIITIRHVTVLVANDMPATTELLTVSECVVVQIIGPISRFILSITSAHAI